MAKKSKKDEKKKKSKKKQKQARSMLSASTVTAAFASVDSLNPEFRDDGTGQLTAEVTADVNYGQNQEPDGPPSLTVTDEETGTILGGGSRPMEPGVPPRWQLFGQFPGEPVSGRAYRFEVVAKFVVRIESSTSSSAVRTAP